MKLELKHLAGYLPYGLEVFRENKSVPSDTFVIKGATKENVFLSENGLVVVDIDRIKPILHPLSDLRKVWKEMTNEEQNIVMHFGDMNEKNLWQEPFFIIEILFKYHFDIYGLIENGLAIDINTL